MTPKERVRLNIYKALLKEEKNKNKKMSFFSSGVFACALFMVFSYNEIKTTTSKDVLFVSNGRILSKQEENILEKIYESGIFNEQKYEINTDELFGVNMKL